MNWNAAPIALTVSTMRLLSDMRGVPYHSVIKQFKSAYMYGNPENASVEPFLIILLNVGLHS